MKNKSHQLNQAYIEAKKRASRFFRHRGNFNQAKELPPGQHLINQMVPMPPITRSYPVISKNQWQLNVFGEVEKELNFNWLQFNQLPQKNFVVDFHCVTGWSKLGQKFSGVDFKEIIKLAKPKPTARFVIFEGADGGYTTNIRYDELLTNLAFIALKIDGGDIPPQYGGPARMVIPHLYGWKSCKFLIGISFQSKDKPGFWEVRGYHNHANPWREERYG